MELIRRLLRRMTAVSDWSLWSLPRWLTVFVLTVVAVDAAAIGVAASFTTITTHDLLLFGLLLSCTALAVRGTLFRCSASHRRRHGYPLWLAIVPRECFVLIVGNKTVSGMTDRDFERCYGDLW